jgi:anti-sigma regulatory factor (Ser/Thr protein kinase)
VIGRPRKVPVKTDADVSRSVVETIRFCRDLGFDEQSCSRIGTAVSELARNIVKYADRGEIVLSQLSEENRSGIRVDALDIGPGIADSRAALRDHFSTSGTLGLGLPGVKRMMDGLEIGSNSGRGAKVSFWKWLYTSSMLNESAVRGDLSKAAVRKMPTVRRSFQTSGEYGGLEYGAYGICCSGELVSGDGVFVEQKDESVIFAIIDALGHGPRANAISVRAKGALRSSWSQDAAETLRMLHRALSDTEGAAASVCLLNPESKAMQAATVGNTSIKVMGGSGQTLAATAGTLGSSFRSLQVHSVTLRPGQSILLHTDGLSDRSDLESLPASSKSSASAAAKALVDKCGKSHDDATCMVVNIT